jgi:CTP:molybdopterin cytidylyltransferase MocA
VSRIVAAVVLAAGGGRRYGMPKALVEHEGSLLVERAVRTARAVCDPVLVVLGAQAVDVWRQADLDGATVLANKDWESGMASSLRTGLGPRPRSSGSPRWAPRRRSPRPVTTASAGIRCSSAASTGPA